MVAYLYLWLQYISWSIYDCSPLVSSQGLHLSDIEHVTVGIHLAKGHFHSNTLPQWLSILLESFPRNSSPPPHTYFFNNRKQSATVFHRKLTLVPSRCHWVSVLPASAPQTAAKKENKEYAPTSSFSYRPPRGGSHAWAFTGNMLDWYKTNRRLSSLESYLTYISNPLRQLNDKALITATGSFSKSYLTFKGFQGLLLEVKWGFSRLSGPN